IGGLSESEAREFGAALWNQRDSFGLPSETLLLEHSFTWLPHPDDVGAAMLVKRFFLEQPIPTVLSEFEGRTVTSSRAAYQAASHLRSIEGATASPLHIRSGRAELEWSRVEATSLLQRLDQWSSQNLERSASRTPERSASRPDDILSSARDAATSL